MLYTSFIGENLKSFSPGFVSRIKFDIGSLNLP